MTLGLFENIFRLFPKKNGLLKMILGLFTIVLGLLENELGPLKII